MSDDETPDARLARIREEYEESAGAEWLGDYPRDDIGFLLALLEESGKVNRFLPFSDQERAFLVLGLTATFCEWTTGMFTGKPASATTQARDAPVMMSLLDEIAAAAGAQPIDADLHGLFVHVLDQAQAKERDTGP